MCQRIRQLICQSMWSRDHEIIAPSSASAIFPSARLWEEEQDEQEEQQEQEEQAAARALGLQLLPLLQSRKST